MPRVKQERIVTGIAQLWSRDILDFRDGKRYLEQVKNLFLKKAGVYILYRDDKPYYIGQARNLFKRLVGYARNPNNSHFNFWNHFTAFVVSEPKYLDDIEAILIRAMPFADNSSKPKISKIKIPSSVSGRIRVKRQTKSSL